MNQDTFQYVKEIQEALNLLSNSSEFDSQVELLAKEIFCKTEENKLTVFFGNGGSAADSQHFSAELVGKYKKNDRKPFKAISLNTDTSFLTAWSNDFDYSSVFKRQIEALSGSIGISIGLSTSGGSQNVLKALEISKKLQIKTFLITGKDCPTYNFIDEIVRLPSNETSVVQTLTQVMYHLICLKLEKH